MFLCIAGINTNIHLCPLFYGGMREIATQFPFKFMKDKRLVLIPSLWNCNRSTLIWRRNLICCWLKRTWSSSHLRIDLVMNLGEDRSSDESRNGDLLLCGPALRPDYHPTYGVCPLQQHSPHDRWCV